MSGIPPANRMDPSHRDRSPSPNLARITAEQMLRRYDDFHNKPSTVKQPGPAAVDANINATFNPVINVITRDHARVVGFPAQMKIVDERERDDIPVPDDGEKHEIPICKQNADGGEKDGVPIHRKKPEDTGNTGVPSQNDCIDDRENNGARNEHADNGEKHDLPNNTEPQEKKTLQVLAILFATLGTCIAIWLAVYPSSTTPPQTTPDLRQLLPPTTQVLSRTFDGASFRAEQAVVLAETLLAQLSVSISNLPLAMTSGNLSDIIYHFNAIALPKSAPLQIINNIISRDIFNTTASALIHLRTTASRSPRYDDNTTHTITSNLFTNISHSLSSIKSHIHSNFTTHYIAIHTATAHLHSIFHKSYTHLRTDLDTYNTDLSRFQRRWISRERTRLTLLARESYLAEKITFYRSFRTGLELLDCVARSDADSATLYVEEVDRVLHLTTALWQEVFSEENVRQLYELEISELRLRDLEMEGVEQQILEKAYGLESRWGQGSGVLHNDGVDRGTDEEGEDMEICM